MPRRKAFLTHEVVALRWLSSGWSLLIGTTSTRPFTVLASRLRFFLTKAISSSSYAKKQTIHIDANDSRVQNQLKLSRQNAEYIIINNKQMITKR